MRASVKYAGAVKIPKTEAKLTPEQRDALASYLWAVKQQDRFEGSIFANPISVRRYEEATRAAYESCKRLGMDYRHGL